MGIEKLEHLNALLSLLRAQAEKTKLETAQFEFLGYLESFLSCVDAFETGVRIFARQSDRDNFLATAQRMVNNFKNNEKWLENSTKNK